MIIQKIEQYRFSKGPANLSSPEDYEFHWTAELKDGTKIEMFDGCDKKSFDLLENSIKENLSCFYWQGVQNKEITFGVSLDNPSRYPAFMLNGNVLRPDNNIIYQGINFSPKCFIRHYIDFSVGEDSKNKDSDKLVYYAGFQSDNKAGFVMQSNPEFYIKYDGCSFLGEGFSNITKIGEYVF